MSSQETHLRRILFCHCLQVIVKYLTRSLKACFEDVLRGVEELTLSRPGAGRMGLERKGLFSLIF
jgi:hypothetical protein